jgi:hypothetical protein
VTQGLQEEERLEAARAQWRSGFQARVRAAEAIFSRGSGIDFPTPHVEGDE